MTQRMVSHILRGDQALINLLLDKRVVLCELFELPLSEAVCAAVSHMTNHKAPIRKGQNLSRAAHAFVIWVLGRVVQDFLIRSAESLLDPVENVPLRPIGIP